SGTSTIATGRRPITLTARCLTTAPEVPIRDTPNVV
ncbi:MAG: hypothetical protein ACI8RE_000968, partial [Ilumatobacter sp.]